MCKTKITHPVSLYKSCLVKEKEREYKTYRERERGGGRKRERKRFGFSSYLTVIASKISLNQNLSEIDLTKLLKKDFEL